MDKGRMDDLEKRGREQLIRDMAKDAFESGLFEQSQRASAWNKVLLGTWNRSLLLDDENWQMSDIPLKVLIVDADQGSSNRLRQALLQHGKVIFTDIRNSLQGTKEIALGQDISAVYIDPLSLGIEETSNFINAVRADKHEIVYVLYMRVSNLGTLDQDALFGRFSFRHYFKLDKNTSKKEFKEEVERTIAECQSDLWFHMKKERIGVLQEELRSLQKPAEKEPVHLSTESLRDLVYVVEAWKTGLKARERRRYSTGFLGSEAESVTRKRCFVVMPYSQDWSEAVESILSSCCKDAGLEFKIAKDMGGRFVPHDIWQGITGSGAIIADLTGGNANVAYEVGLADALGKEVILISQESEVPFDFSGQRLILYENSIPGSLRLEEDLKKRLLSVTRMLEEESE